jgi:hypothetical protein
MSVRLLKERELTLPWQGLLQRMRSLDEDTTKRLKQHLLEY